MALQYKTRGDSSPQGKPRVFFCCHPADFQPFFEGVSAEILEKQNCAIYYYEGEVSAEDRELDLKQMQLFVMPVTTRLLTTENQGLADFRFAVEHHIPVLPLMQESGLEDVFNQKCGDLQFLDKNNQDPTAIPYAEKLKKYLASVLIGDELAVKIRAAFDAYIFLSYRKKDRKLAQELMRLIHRNDFCRDIAIWYDEFLTPGENFNDAIKAALEKCGLFALVVTPNLINEINYIMQVEYPMAKEAGKPILPMEMVPTDADGLRSNYDGIPDAVPTEETALREALLRVAKLLAMRENDDDPEHNYFIGLAYLGGVDVEVDHERALKLITSAADAGLPEALKKLVSMYQNGEGVARNYHTAIQWQEKLVELRTTEFAQVPNETTYTNSFNALWALGNYARDLANLTLAEKAYTRMLELSKSNTYSTCYWHLSISYENLGSIAESKGHLSEAHEYYIKVLAISEFIFFENKTADAQYTLSASQRNVGNILETLGNFDEASVYYKKCLEFREIIVAETNTYRARWDLSISYDDVGRIKQAQGDLLSAIKYFEKSLSLREIMAAEIQTVESRRGLFISYIKVGEIRQGYGDISGALMFFKKSLAIAESIAREANTIQARQDLVLSNIKLGDIYQLQDHFSKALYYYENSMKIALVLADEANTVEIRRNLFVICIKIGDTKKSQGSLSQALEHYEKGLTVSEVLAEETNTLQSKQDLSACYRAMGDIKQALGNLSSALKYYKKSLAISESLEARINTSQARHDLLISYLKVGDILQTQADFTGALEYYQKCLNVAAELAAKQDTVQARRDLLLCNGRVGDIQMAQGNLIRALECYKKCLLISESLATEINTVNFRRDHSISHEKVGHILAAQGDLIGALDCYKKCSEIRESLVVENPTAEARRYLAISYNNLGDVQQSFGNTIEALECYKKGLALFEVLAQELGTLQSYDDWAVSCYNVGSMGKLEYLRKAYEIWSMLAQQFPQNPIYAQRRDIAKNLLDRPSQD